MAIIKFRDAHGNDVLPVADWVDRVIKVTLDSGSCDHVLDVADAPGYASFFVESPGSRRDKQYIVGSGAEVRNAGQVTLDLEADGFGDLPGNLIKSVFQVVEITRPLMSMSRFCELGKQSHTPACRARVVAELTKMQAGAARVARMHDRTPEQVLDKASDKRRRAGPGGGGC